VLVLVLFPPKMLLLLSPLVLESATVRDKLRTASLRAASISCEVSALLLSPGNEAPSVLASVLASDENSPLLITLSGCGRCCKWVDSWLHASMRASMLLALAEGAGTASLLGSPNAATWRLFDACCRRRKMIT
jgi:hypothetical protein